TLGAVLGLALAIVVTAAAMLRRAESDLLDAQRHSELNEAAQTAAVLTRRLVELQRVLQATAAQLDAATLSDERQLLHFLETRSLLCSMFFSVVIAATDGTALARLDAQGVQRPNQS